MGRFSVLYKTVKRTRYFAYIEFEGNPQINFGIWIKTSNRHTLPKELSVSEDEAMGILFLTKI